MTAPVRTTLTRNLLLGLALFGTLPPTVPAAGQDRSAAPETIERLVGAPRLDRTAILALYDRAVLNGTAANVRERLDGIAAAAASPGMRASALLAGAVIDWNRGFLDQANQATDRALALEAGFDASLLKAQLLDAQGDAAAAGHYLAAAAAAANPQERFGLQLRAALVGDGIRTFAASPTATPTALRNGVAEVLALLGRPADAALLYRPSAAAGPLAPQFVTQAQWAAAAGDAARLRTAAWQAFDAAADPVDRRYALALLAESYRDARDLPGLLAALDQRTSDPLVQEVRIDALLDLGRFDAAVTVARSGSADLRRRLPAILDLAERRPALIAEYGRLIAAQPHEQRWYDGLAALHMSAGDAEQAAAVYRQLLAANRRSVPILVGAARQMIAMGLVDQALATVATLGNDRAALVPVQLFLFETYRVQGRDDAALAVLAALRQRLAPADPALVDVADGYESIGRRDLALATLTAMEAAGRAPDYDGQVHMADLAAATGRAADALARLRRLQETATVPARRAYLNTRIAALSRDTGGLEQLNAQLDARLAAGRVAAADFDLLLQMRENAKDVAGARALVQRYAAQATDLTGLKQLASLYERQKDYGRANALYRRLAETDPGGAAPWLQRLVGNLVRGRGEAMTSEQRQAEITALLGRLRRPGGPDGPGADAFGAGIYALANLPDRAVAAYRTAIAAAPRDTDLPQRLALVLSGQGRSAEALALLQYRAENAPDRPALLAAADGVLTLASGGSGGGDNAGGSVFRRARLAWLTRLLLARIAERGGDGPVYAGLADAAGELGDYDLQRHAMEQALAAATGDGRSALLRQLIAMNTVNNDTASGIAIGNNDRKVRYGRRLIALRKSFPPDVYTDLGRALLAEGDVAGAERAFALLEDIPGIVNTDEARGDAFAAAGYRSRALASYARGLLRSQNDYDLLLKTSLLRETQGEAALANRWYWQALRRLLAQQPLLGTEPSAEARWYGETLTEGLVVTWPDGAPATAIVADLESLIAQTLAQSGGADRTGWRGQLRLPMMMQLAARIAARAVDPAIAGRVDALLRPRFGGDPDYARDVAGSRMRAAAGTGASMSEAVVADLSSQAAAFDNANLAVALALSRHDLATIDAHVARAIELERARRARPDEAGARRLGLTPIQATLLLAATALPQAEFREHLLAPLDRTPFRDLVLFDLFRANPALLARLDQAAGKPLLGDDRLAGLLVTNENDPVPWIPRDGSFDPVAAMVAHFTVDQRIALLAAFVDRQQASGVRSFLQPVLIADLLGQSLDAGRRTRFLALLRRDLALAPAPADGAGDPWPKTLLVLDAAADRRTLLVEAAEAVATSFPDKRYVATALRAFFAGDRAAAFDVLMQRQESATVPDPSDTLIPTLVKRVFAPEWRAGAERFLSDPHPSAEARERFVGRYLVADRYGAFGGTPTDRRRYYGHLVVLDGDDPSYVAGLADLLGEAGDQAALAATLAAYVDRRRTDQEAATDLQLVHLIRREPDKAGAVARSSGVDATDADWIVQMTNRAAQSRLSTSQPDFRTLFSVLYDTLETQQPTLPVVAEVRRRRQVDQTATPPPGPLAPLAPVLAAFAANPAAAPAAFHDLWRRSASAAPDQQDSGLSRTTLLQALPNLREPPKPTDDPVDPRLVPTLTSTPAMTAELERDLTGLAPVVQQTQQPMYDLVAEGLVRQGAAAARTDALLAALSAGGIDRHQLQLLATLLNRQARAPDAAQVEALRAAVASTGNIGANLHAELSTVFAMAGDAGAAGQLMEAAMMQTLYPPGGYSAVASDQVSPTRLVAALRRWTDKAAAGQVYRRLAALLDTARGGGSVPVVNDRLPPLEAAP